jgi:hypothetical protein
MLTKTATFTPKITFTESYNETLKTTTEVVEGETFVNRGIVSSGTNNATIVASMAGIDLTKIDATTEVIVSLGTFVHSALLGEDPAYTPGKTSATFKLPGLDANGNEISVGSVKYVWTKTTLTVTISTTRSPEFGFAFQDFPALVPPAPPNRRSATFDTEIEASVGFGDTGGTCSHVYVTGKVTGDFRVYGPEDAPETYDLMSATISGSSDFVPPTVAFTAPADKLRTTGAAVTVTGTVKDPHLSDKVLVRVNGGPFTEITLDVPAGATSMTWQLDDIPLVAGPNIIEAKAADAAGNERALVSRKITRVVMTPLAVTHTGLGSVSAGFEPNSNREIGASYTITATPGKGQVFDGWLGVVSKSAKLTFTMTEGLSLTAQFIPNPFPAIVGDYRGLAISANPAVVAENGGFSLVPTGTGSFTFKLSLGAMSYPPATSKLWNDGTASFSISRGTKPPLLVTLQVAMGAGDGSVSGTITSADGLTITLTGARTVVDAMHPVPVGAYTLLFPVQADDEDGPNVGSASLTIAAKGAVSIKGSLSDKSTFTADTFISKEGVIPVFAKIGTGLKTMVGQLQYNSLQTAPEGNLKWLASPATETPLLVIGSLYTPPAVNKRVLDSLDGSNGAGKVTLSSGGLVADIAKNITVSATGVVTVKTPGADKLTLTTQPKLGTFTGSFMPPGATKTATITGVFFERLSLGIGLFTTANGTVGHVRIEATPP